MKIQEFTYTQKFHALDFEDAVLVLRMKFRMENGLSIAERTKLEILEMLKYPEFADNIDLVY